MSIALEINGKKLVPIKNAAPVVSYSRDYITRLARDGKVVATHIGRQWYVDIDSLKHYAAVAEDELSIRKQQLSEERKQERKIKKSVEALQATRAKKVKAFHANAVVVTAMVLGVGLVSGLFVNESNWFNQTANRFSESRVEQLANVNQGVSQASKVIISDTGEVIHFPEFTHEYSQLLLDGEQTGVLLLPQALPGDVVKVQDYFSDEVVIEKKSDGTAVVRRADKQTGEIPFVLVPVTSSP
ncbi:MAG: hypothetical protein AAB388_04575 [Patescibacteria group bacterium]